MSPWMKTRQGSGDGSSGQEASANPVAVASALCADRGVRLTRLRRLILELLWERGRPTGAYELIEALKERDSRSVGPPTVYRTLDFLITQGLVSKIESRNAYVPCAHPERSHGCVFFICGDCGASSELEDRRVEQLIAEDAADLGFRVHQRVVEVQGTCMSCVSSDDAGDRF